MGDTPWHRQKRHFRALADQLADEGFTVLDAWIGRHLRLRVRQGAREVTITCSTTPRVPEIAVNATMRQARKGMR